MVEGCVSYPYIRGEDRSSGLAYILRGVPGEVRESRSTILPTPFRMPVAGRSKVVSGDAHGRDVKTCRGRKAATF